MALTSLLVQKNTSKVSFCTLFFPYLPGKPGTMKFQRKKKLIGLHAPLQLITVT
ncbi:MAG: hypothetical protein HGA72_08140 [Chlorobiaceae bacterium]|nr:hypothetical protein [Chlorobiaceae bacterium]